MPGSEIMSGSTERKRLECSKKGDEIAIGFQRTAMKSNLALEHIRKLVAGDFPNLKVMCAFDVDKGAKTSFDYITSETTPCPDPKTGGSFIRLLCTADVARPSELLRPVYDFCDCLSNGPDIWYYQDGLAPIGRYEIAEARVERFNLSYKDHGYGPYPSETYYLDRMKMLRVIEKLTLPLGKGGNGEIRGLVERDAYYIYKDWGFIGSDLNWQLAQSGLVSKIICHMRKDSPRITISGRLETDSTVRKLLGDVDRDFVYLNLFRELQGDESIHLALTERPIYRYVSGYWTWVKDKPGAV
jgi:hypothetical protein